MNIRVFEDKQDMGRAAAADGVRWICKALAEKGEANVIVATGASQFEVLDALLAEAEIAWERVRFFHLDEYVGLDIRHPASFRNYIWNRLHKRFPVPPLGCCYLNGEKDPEEECRRAGALILQHPVDVCFAGIGENGHLAFNDPPADFETETPYLVVELDEACRRQQLGEGWFSQLEEVPIRAISMSIRHILKSEHLIITCPDARKAEAVQKSVEGPVHPDCPASILQTHPDCGLYVDSASAALLSS